MAGFVAWPAVVARAVAWTPVWANRGVGILGILGEAGAQCRLMRGSAHTFCLFVVSSSSLPRGFSDAAYKAVTKPPQRMPKTCR